MSKHRETKGNPFHGNNTLIKKVREGLSLSSVPVYHGRACKHCRHFSECAPLKGRIDDSTYCRYPSRGFVPGPQKPARSVC